MRLQTSGRVSTGRTLPNLRASNRKVMCALLAGLDVSIIVLATTLAVALREAMPLQNTEVSANVAVFAWTIPFGWLALLGISGAYACKWLGNGMAEYNRVLAGGFTCMAGVGVGAYLLGYDLSRGFYLLLFAIGMPAMIVGRYVMRRAMNQARARGVMVTRTLLVGSSGHVGDLLAVLNRERWLGYQIEGLLLHVDDVDPSHGEIPVLGAPDDIVQVIQATGAEAVIFGDGAFSHPDEFSMLARELEDLDAQTIFVPSVTNICAGRLQTRPVAGIPLVFVERPHAARAGSLGKRLFDILGSLAALLVFSPVLAITALAIVLSDRGPVFFRQQRVGIGGRPFTCLKLRSMVVDAEARMAKLASQSQGNGVLFKMVNDPRVTRVGAFIRRYSIDELPQLFNVLKGDMSLIGPRPALPTEVDLYEEHVLRRLAVRPGMTGLWQVSGRSRLSWTDTVRLDLYYVDNWSFMQDINIMLRTVGAVLRPNGAY